MCRTMFIKWSLIFLMCILSARALDDACLHRCSKDGSCSANHYNNGCYYIFTGLMTWEETREFCSSKGLGMIKITKDMIQKKFNFKGFIENSNVYAWLGGRALDLDSWTFVNGVNMNDTLLSEQPRLSPDSQIGQLCGTVNEDVTVDRNDCRNIHNFICRFGDLQGIPSFYISETPANWFEARSLCVDIGGDLFYLEKGENMTEMLSTNLLPYKEIQFFIGLTHTQWQWEDGNDILHYNWKNAVPGILPKQCIVMEVSSGWWDAMDCQDLMRPVCQGVPVSVPPAADLITQSTFVPSTESETTSVTTSNAAIVTLSVLLAIFLISTVVLVILLIVFRKNEKCATRWKKDRPLKEEASKMAEESEPLFSQKDTIDENIVDIKTKVEASAYIMKEEDETTKERNRQATEEQGSGEEKKHNEQVLNDKDTSKTFNQDKKTHVDENISTGENHPVKPNTDIQVEKPLEKSTEENQEEDAQTRNEPSMVPNSPLIQDVSGSNEPTTAEEAAGQITPKQEDEATELHDNNFSSDEAMNEEERGYLSTVFKGGWPFDVYFQDQESSCQISLTLPSVEIAKRYSGTAPLNMWLLKKKTLADSEIELVVELNTLTRDKQKYTYEVKLPEKIVPKYSRVTIAKGYVTLELEKVDAVSWKCHEEFTV